jgi:protein-S-isoprenylcysteine O-methyltransferase Ste14
MATVMTKDWWKSKGIWGAIVAAVGLVLGAFGVSVDTAAWTDVVVAAGIALGWWGRVTAKQPINTKKVLPKLRG